MWVARHDSLNDLTASRWDRTCPPRRFYASYDWLRVAAATADPAVEAPFYLWAEHGGTDFSLPCYPIGPASPFPFCRLDLVLARARPDAAVLTAGLMPSLLLGGRNPGHTGFGTAAAGAAGTDAGEAALALLERAEAEARRRELRTVAMLYVDEDDAVTRTTLEESGYQGLRHTAASYLTVPAGGFDGYLDGLTRKAASTVRREVKKLAAAGVSYDVVEPSDTVLAEVDGLERNLNRKYGGIYDDAAVARLRATMSEHLTGLLVARARLGDRTVASLLIIRWRDELYARTVGFDYQATAGLPVYFGLLFYFLVGWAQDNGIRGVSYSTGTEDAKRRRGCVGIGQYAYVKALDDDAADSLDRYRSEVR